MQAPLMVGQLRSYLLGLGARKSNHSLIIYNIAQCGNTSSEAGFLLSTPKLVYAKILLALQANEFLSKLIGSGFKTSYTLVT